MEYAMLIAISLGYACAIVFGLRMSWFVVKVVRAIPFRIMPRRNLVSALGIVGISLSVPFALFLATVVGGTVGGGYGEWLFALFGLSRFGPIVGVPVGIMFVSCVITCVGAFLGSLIGRLMTYALYSHPTP
jgi:hypothetical protein